LVESAGIVRFNAYIAEPKKPGRPTNVTLGEKMIRDHKVAVLVAWSPPASTEFPIVRYKVRITSLRKEIKFNAHFTPPDPTQ